MTTPITEAAVEAPIITYANTFAGGDPVNDLAIVLMKQWGESDPTSIVALFPVSFVANFADMARATLTAALPLIEAEIRGQVAADCRVEAENVDLEVPNAYREGTRDGYLSAATIAERTQR